MTGPTAAGSPREPVVDQMVEVWASLVTACQRVGADGWESATTCPGWTVRDHLSHLVGIERMLLGDPPPPPPPEFGPHVTNEFGRLNEAWVDARRTVPGDEVLAELVGVTDRRITALAAMGRADFDRVGWSPLGERPYREFMASRIVDTWAHEQDIRDALSRPGGRNGAGETIVLDRCVETMAYVVGKRVAPPDGTSVLFLVTGVLARRALVAVAGGRASLVAVPQGTGATVTLTLDQGAFWRLGFGRADPSALMASGEVRLEGHVALGVQVLESMPFMT